jgi:RPA family protein
MTDGIRRREVALRLFAHELSRSTHKIEPAGEREPAYVLTPTGAKVNRVFSVGVLLDKEEVRPDSNLWRLRVSDPTGVFTAFIGRYQPDALESVIEIEPPELIAIVGKVRVFEGLERNFVRVVPENINVVDRTTRDIWVCETARRTLERLKEFGKTEDSKLAMEIYNTDINEYLGIVKQALAAIVEEQIQEITEPPEEEEEEEFEGFEFEEEEWDLSDLLED